MNPWLCNLLFNNSGGSSLPATGQTFYAPLKTSLVPEVGTGGPTWSRATTAWRFNDQGYLQQIPSGCAEFGGARLVRNTVRTKSEDFSNAAWVKTNLTVTGTNVLVCSNSTADNSVNQATDTNFPTIAGQYFMYSIRAKRVAGGVSFVQIGGSSTSFGATAFCTFSLIDGTYAAQTGVTVSVTQISSDTYDFSVRLLCTTTTTSSDVFYVSMQNGLSDTRKQLFVGDGVKSFELLRAWSVDVTNYDASYVPEYVSVGVLSAPYHGAGIDGAKYFETDWQGAPIPAANLLGFRRESAATNNLLHCRDLTNKAWIVPTTVGPEKLTNGTFDANIIGWTDYNGAVSSWSAGAISIVHNSSASGSYATFGTTIGQSYTVSVEVVSSTGYNTNTVFRVGSGSVADAGLADSTQFTGPGSKTISFIATGTTSYVYLRNASSATTVWDNVTVKGSSVQPTKTATGIDGIANTATTLTATAADATILQPMTIASAARCASVYVRRKTGTGTISFTQDGGSTWTDITALINSSTWTRVQITSTLANPSVGFKLGTSGDAIDVDCVQNEAGAVATSPIVTTTAVVTRNADSLTYQTAGNIDAALGTLFCEYSVYEETIAAPRAVIGLSTTAATANALLLHATSVATSSLSSGDGTTIFAKTGLGSAVNTKRKAAVSWGTGRSLTAEGLAPQAGAFSGTLPSAAIAPGAYTNGTFPINGYIGSVAIYNYKMTDAELQAITT